MFTESTFYEPSAASMSKWFGKSSRRHQRGPPSEPEGPEEPQSPVPPYHTYGQDRGTSAGLLAGYTSQAAPDSGLKKYPSKAKPTHPSTTTRKGKGKAATAPPPEGRGSRGENAVAGPSGSPVTEEIDDGEIEVRDEQWDVYFHAFLLHYTRHSECYWYRDSWWFPETGRNEKTLHMFVAARWAPIDNLKYYNLHLPNGKIMENVML
ncbi:hypothetical protein, variant 4 [Cryptococcus amylolentus CBS 6039]|uniref:Uncharacterized protein n=1 Tax=Cryptococcus amylolentus CBS 6039 TaxID=1295533 RepID=A0A1E3HW32_9TREE|nr:hypothetical protein, variant 4 [Cryptococcus amylolentus CBS 6039]ODN80522.1 hypothetical protein, variant 4 [Cryptococcus amylolentus CBS 6039]